jgi:hypothetical protein
MSLPLDAYECLKKAQSCFDMANLATAAGLKDQYLELAKQYTELAGTIERLQELHSDLEKVRTALVS